MLDLFWLFCLFQNLYKSFFVLLSAPPVMYIVPNLVKIKWNKAEELVEKQANSFF